MEASLYHVPRKEVRARAEEVLESRSSAIDLILEDLREESISQLPPGAERTVVTVG